jgi:SAM-dependent methyltransferase
MREGYNDNSAPVADTSYHVHETILSMIQPGRGKAVDIGAGFGLLSKSVADMGYDVTACELDPVRLRHIRLLGLKCEAVDLDKRFPFKNASFDLATCSDVIEHLISPYSFLSEVGRIVKKGGAVIISTPNILGWYSRLKFLSTGLYNNYFIDKDFEGEGYHISPMHYQQLKWGLEKSGFEITDIRSNQYSGLINLGNPKIFLASLFAMPFRVFMKPKNKAILEGDILIIKARKVR